MRVLLVTPPMTQLNTPYPATAYLTGFLRARGYDAIQRDPAIELVRRLFSPDGLTQVAERLDSLPVRRRSPAVRHFLAARDGYLRTVSGVMSYLSGRDPALAMRLAMPGFLPQGPRMAQALAGQRLSYGGDGAVDDPLNWAFGALGLADRAKYLASLYLGDLAAVIQEGIDPRFTLSRYGERLAASVPTMDPLLAALHGPRSLVDEMVDDIAEQHLLKEQPAVLGLTVPFPGNVYGALRIAAVARRVLPTCRVALGGGYVNTELRELADPRLFDYVDYVTLDDGQQPLALILDHVQGKVGDDGLLRTFVRRPVAAPAAPARDQVLLLSSPTAHDVPFRASGTPTYDGLPLASYLSVMEMLNPMHRVWSDGRWNKLTLAHGCYWKGCNFCDISLDYIGRYEEQTADAIVDKMLALMAETGQSGFHFVDEAAPPKVLLALASRLKARGVEATWWGNVRFEKTFASAGVAERLAQAGMVAVSGGLEVASDRLLKLMNKGVSVDQVARVAHALASAGILVHAYLMYGFPTQTVQETVDALERVRQLFAKGCIHSAYWHRFSATVHSPIGQDPDRFGIKLLPRPKGTFANNDVDFEDPTGVDHDSLGRGLNKALYNYMHGIGLDEDVRCWFDDPVPKAKVPRTLIERALKGPGGKS